MCGYTFLDLEFGIQGVESPWDPQHKTHEF